MNKTVLITGASSGFGKLTAITLAKAGYRVIATMRNVLTNNAASARELSQEENIYVIEMNVADELSVNKAVKEIKEKFATIDVVVNNAAIWGAGIAEAYSIEQHKKMFDVNYFGIVRVYNAVLPTMRNQGSGLFINISSGASGFTNPYLVPYFASKMAVEAFTEGMQEELRPFKIDNVSIQPGVFDTGINAKQGLPPDNPEIIENYGEKASIPMQKMITALLGSAGKYDMNPQMIADGILKITKIDQGKRPLRFPIDPVAEGTDIEFIDARAAIKEKWSAKYGF